MVRDFLRFAVCGLRFTMMGGRKDERIDDDSMKDDEWMMNRVPK